ncbi:hypothetical protein QIS74_06645 [Colletotrichum tabaci]|uniref:Uncharacterized protein n=1 Tax=Colletotrichum tabaci TaxID=1209068 RepID=A0AAV9TC69_9PEZI
MNNLYLWPAASVSRSSRAPYEIKLTVKKCLLLQHFQVNRSLRIIRWRHSLEVYTGETTPYACTLDITHGMRYGLFQLDKLVPPEQMNDGMRSLVAYLNDRKKNVMSHCDGGQLMFNFIIGGNGLLWSAHLGAYEGIVSKIEPKPKIAILGIAGRANLDGRPFDGSAAQFALKQIHWLDQPETVIWCLHDERSYKEC